MSLWPSHSEGNEDISRIPLSALYRWYMYDLDFEAPNDYTHVFDLLPVSEEGDEKEMQDAQERMARIDPLMSFIKLYGEMNSSYMFELQKPELLKMVGDAVDSEKQLNTIKKLYYQITVAGLISALSSALELGIIKADNTYTEIG